MSPAAYSLPLLLLLTLFNKPGSSICPEDERIQCRSNNRCTLIGYICDGDNDCGDNSDEENDLCKAWRNDECGRGKVMCQRFGGSGCVDITDYCQQPCGGTLDRRVCVMLEADKLQPLREIPGLPNAATTTTTTTQPPTTTIKTTQPPTTTTTTTQPATRRQEVGAAVTPAPSPLQQAMIDTDSANIITISMTNTIITKGASNGLFLAKLLEAIQTCSQPTMEGGKAGRLSFSPASD